MHAADALKLDRLAFEAQYRAVPQPEIDALVGSARVEWFDKVREATGHIDESIDRVRREQSRPPNGNELDKKRAERAARNPPSSADLWARLGLALNEKRAPIVNETNAVLLLRNHEDWKNRIWYDLFHNRIFYADGAVTREWSDVDDVGLAIWAQSKCDIGHMSVNIMRHAVTQIAKENSRNECVDWLNALEWDGTDRVEHFIPDMMGGADDEYTRTASRNFWISVAARALSPGCQVDNMLVLEGKQGIGKSRALRAIGGAWYAEAHESLREKDFFLALQGKLIIEITEMDAFSRADTTRVKQVVTCCVDRYRAPYDARTVDHPRNTVFCGTTNDDAYLRDVTGGRRFWPVRCGEIRVDLIKEEREQLFAEAVHRYMKGEPWWDMPVDATLTEQAERQQGDPWEAGILSYLEGRKRADVSGILGSLGLEVKHFDKSCQMRVSDVLRANGWTRKRLFENGRQSRIWMKT